MSSSENPKEQGKLNSKHAKTVLKTLDAKDFASPKHYYDNHTQKSIIQF